MKKVSLIITLLIAFLVVAFILSCKRHEDKPEKDWVVEVHYLDKTTDTLKIRSQYDASIEEDIDEIRNRKLNLLNI